MTQPPGQQQPQGGSGVSQDSRHGFPQPPAQPPRMPPTQPGCGYPQRASGPPGPYDRPPRPCGQQPGPYSGYLTQPQYPGAPTPPGGGSGFIRGGPSARLSRSEIGAGFTEPRTVYADGRFFLTATSVSALKDAEERETKTLMAFGK